LTVFYMLKPLSRLHESPLMKTRRRYSPWHQAVSSTFAVADDVKKW